MAAFKLLVEGDDDENIIFHLLKRHNIIQQSKNHASISESKKDMKINGKSFGIEPVTGLKNLNQRRISNELKGSEIESLGIIVDADGDEKNDNLENRWKSLSDILRSLGYKLPKTHKSEGSIIIHDPDADSRHLDHAQQ